MSNGDDVKLLRKSHVKRIYKDDDPVENPDLWIDVERIDELFLVLGRQFAWQTNRWTFDWDSFNPDGENVTKKKVKSPDDDPNDDSNAIEVPVRDMVFVTRGKEQQFQAYRHYFINDDSNSTRETHSRRVYHYDIPDKQLDGDKNPPRDPEAYMNALADRDKDQYVESEILEKYWTNERLIRDAHGNIIVGQSGHWQEKRWLLDIKGVDPLLKDRDGDTSKDGTTINPQSGQTGSSVTVDPPWRLDPLQNIVNVSLLGGLAVEFYHD